MEFRIGNLDKRELHLVFYAPTGMQMYDGSKWRLSPIRLLNPMRWWRAIKVRWNWHCWCRLYRQLTHRCYCPCGSCFDGRICLAGFGVSWFYSHYTGEVPCICDKTIAEIFSEVNDAQ